MRQGFERFSDDGPNPRYPCPEGDWWDDGSHCGTCGADWNRLVMDHCHITGWNRGRICAGCNGDEGRSGDEPGSFWWRWRRTAPLLVQRETYEGVNQTGRVGYVSMLSDKDLASGLSMDELLELHWTRRDLSWTDSSWTDPRSRVAKGLPYW